CISHRSATAVTGDSLPCPRLLLSLSWSRELDALSLHDALPISLQPTAVAAPRGAVHRHSARHVVSLSFGGSGKSSSRERTPPRRHSRRAGASPAAGSDLRRTRA